MRCLTDSELCDLLAAAKREGFEAGKREGRAAAVKAATTYLNQTAADHRKMATRVVIPEITHFSRAGAVANRDALISKAQLLEEQAGHIRGFA